jgi:hypothetical protein
VDRKLLVGGVAALLAILAVLALVGGGVVGRSIVSAPDPRPATPPATPTNATVRFKDTLTDVSIAYPATWVRRLAKDQGVRIIASAPDDSAAVSVSVRKIDLEPVTFETLPIVRPLTDGFLREDTRIKTIGEPTAVTLDGLPGYRYTYEFRTAGGTDGAHIHYYLFKAKRLIQIVLQAVPASRLPALQPSFDRIATSFDAP